MNKRKNLSKKIRFDVFKRDGFICQYCGNSPPAVILEVDHIAPVSKGGANDEDNLLTACFDCNRGKAANNLNISPKTIAEKAKIIAEKEDQIIAFNKLLSSVRRRETRNIKRVEKIFSDETGYQFTDTFKESIRINFLQKMPISEIEDAMKISLHIADPCDFAHENANAISKYFCGVCWNKLRASEGG